ncbi:MAG: NPCBM/NEW2 domain-containing protein [Armatimonadia bacterium]
MARVNLLPLLMSAGIAGVAIGLGVQSLIRDFLSGLFMMMEGQFAVGDTIMVDGTLGRVQELGLRVTVLRDLQGCRRRRCRMEGPRPNPSAVRRSYCLRRRNHSHSRSPTGGAPWAATLSHEALRVSRKATATSTAVPPITMLGFISGMHRFTILFLGLLALLMFRQDARADIFADATRGDITALAADLAADPSLMRAVDPVHGGTPLHWALYGDRFAAVSLLLQSGADPNARNLHGLTPLHGAAIKGDLRAIRLLLSAGADPGLLDGDGRSPLDCAVERGQDAAAGVLEGAQVELMQRLQQEDPPAEGIWLDSVARGMTSGWGVTGMGRSVEGRPLRLDGLQFLHGVGAHAVSRCVLRLKGMATRLQAVVGLDDEAPGGTVAFRVEADGKLLARTEVLHRDSPARLLSVDLTGKDEVVLIIEDGGDGIGSDHGDWAGATLLLTPEGFAHAGDFDPDGLRLAAGSVEQPVPLPAANAAVQFPAPVPGLDDCLRLGEPRSGCYRFRVRLSPTAGGTTAPYFGIALYQSDRRVSAIWAPDPNLILQQRRQPVTVLLAPDPPDAVPDGLALIPPERLYYEAGAAGREQPWLPDLAHPGQKLALDPARRLDVLIVGEGYLPDERAEFEQRVRSWYARFLSQIPFQQLKGAFRVTAVWAPSLERVSAAQKSRYGLPVKSQAQGYGGSVAGPVSAAGAEQITADLQTIGANGLEYDGRLSHTVVVLVGKGVGSGCAGNAKVTVGGRQIIVNTALGENSIHEFCHVLFPLRDEYIYNADATVNGPEIVCDSMTNLRNSCFDRRRSRVPWAHLAPGGALNRDTDSVIGKLWVGGWSEHGVWHCEPKCLMNGGHNNWDLAKTKRGAWLRQERLCFWCEEIVAARVYYLTGQLGTDPKLAWQEWVTVRRSQYESSLDVAKRVQAANEEYRLLGCSHSPLCEDLLED